MAGTSYPENRPLVIDILRGLSPSSILDCGCGSGHYGKLIRDEFPGVRLDGIEIFEDYRNNEWFYYDKVTIGNILDGVPGGYDVYMFVDILEHLPRIDALIMLAEIPGDVLAVIPVDYAQGPVDGNPWQEHISEWSVNDFIGWECTTVTHWGTQFIIAVRRSNASQEG